MLHKVITVLLGAVLSFAAIAEQMPSQAVVEHCKGLGNLTYMAAEARGVLTPDQFREKLQEFRNDVSNAPAALVEEAVLALKQGYNSDQDSNFIAMEVFKACIAKKTI